MNIYLRNFFTHLSSNIINNNSLVNWGSKGKGPPPDSSTHVHLSAEKGERSFNLFKLGVSSAWRIKQPFHGRNYLYRSLATEIICNVEFAFFITYYFL